MTRLLWRALATLCLCWHAVAGAQDGELTGTLKRARETSSVVIGFREASFPFSYLNAKGEPVGYSIDLCRGLVDAMSDEVGRELVIRWRPVTSATRLQAVASGEVDLECGSTTSNVERQKVVAFSPTIFVSGTRLLVRRDSPVRSFRDLAGKGVAVTGGTTNEKTLRELAEKFRVDMKLVAAPDHGEAFAMLKAGKVDAFATDEVLLYGLLAREKAQQEYTIVGEFLSYDPYGIAFRKGDAQLASLVKRSFSSMAESRELQHRYDQWFMHRLPSGERLNLPINPQLSTLFRALSTQPE
ncbi:amino acid ABC transporter substrate-binding protein [Aquincola sp. S2]|uniref:Amino acid ABC transporter substrate-binding protein n=1 Tax=Pseudaquabacterium terrae TaxID=2732868 RepID=A0ABX2EUP2_9BURK|nr:amino acid ABC transporter substrate-binding protein [Aquabacterium terrae]NRF72190.1 amino acid ABC transporter substrate-binding protein [Aquabacterium terrae]